MRLVRTRSRWGCHIVALSKLALHMPESEFGTPSEAAAKHLQTHQWPATDFRDSSVHQGLSCWRNPFEVRFFLIRIVLPYGALQHAPGPQLNTACGSRRDGRSVLLRKPKNLTFPNKICRLLTFIVAGNLSRLSFNSPEKSTRVSLNALLVRGPNLVPTALLIHISFISASLRQVLSCSWYFY
jgi:hypothetical protein